MTTATETLTALRSAALRRDWNSCRAAAGAALSRLPAARVFSLAHQEVRRRLPLFERHHPGVHWPRVWLDALSLGELGSLNDTSVEVEQDTPGPGGASFTKAVIALFRAAEEIGVKRVTHAVVAIAEAIMAEMMETGGSDHPEVWDAWYREALTGAEPLYPDALLILMNDPKVAATELAAWNRLADELSAALDMTQ